MTARKSIALHIMILLIVSTVTGCGQVSLPFLPSTPTPTPTSAPVFQPPDSQLDSTQTPLAESSPTPLSLPVALPTPTPLPTATPRGPWLTGDIRVYPGPLHYSGDLLSVEVGLGNIGGLEQVDEATLTINNDVPLQISPYPVYSPLRENALAFRWAWDTTSYVGVQRLTVTIPIQGTDPLTMTAFVDILPAESKPTQEVGARWLFRNTGCCRIAFVTKTAAARDIVRIDDLANSAVLQVERKVGFPVSGKPIPLTFIDNMWGNGAYASQDVVFAYVDRAYTGLDLQTVLQHEVTHYAMRPLDNQTPTMLVEGVAVYVADGHYKPEPLPERASALLKLNEYIPLTDLATNFRAHQHEVAYIEAGAFVAYLSETYGWGRFLNVYSADDLSNEPAEFLDQALNNEYGVTLDEAEEDFRAWLLEKDPGDQTRDLQLSIVLYDMVRRYQDIYAPYQESLPTADSAAEVRQTSEFIRESVAPENQAIEAMLVSAIKALKDHRYDDSQALLHAASNVLDTGLFEDPVAADYIEITRVVVSAGYEVEQIELADDVAELTVIKTWPRLEYLTLVRTITGWEIQALNDN